MKTPDKKVVEAMNNLIAALRAEIAAANKLIAAQKAEIDVLRADLTYQHDRGIKHK